MPAGGGEPRPDTVSLDDLFGGGAPSADGADGAGGAGGTDGTDGRDRTPGRDRTAEPEIEPGSWADPATADPAADVAVPEPAVADDLAADDPAAGGADDAGADGAGAPRALSLDQLTGVDAVADTDRPVRTVSLGGAPRRTPRGRDGARARTCPTDDTARPGPPDGDTGPADSRGSRGGGTPGTPDGRRGGRGRRRPAVPENETPAEQETRAREICLRLLTDRARTVKELGDALRRKEIPDEVAHRVLDRFDEVGLVDDKAFADQWVRSRHRGRGLGKRAIALELHRKGVDRETADEALTEIDEDSERERARELVTRRLRGLPVGSREERQSTARKLVGMLARKGYGPGVAYGVVKEEIAAAGADAEEMGEPPEE